MIISKEKAVMDAKSKKIIKSFLILVAVIGIVLLCSLPLRNLERNEINNDDIAYIIPHVSEKRLDQTTVTIEEVVSFEKSYNSQYEIDKRDVKIVKRIFALKHLLLEGLMPEVHRAEDLKKIILIHSGEFSNEQQKLLDWFLFLSQSQQEYWNICSHVNTLQQFRDKLDGTIQIYN